MVSDEMVEKAARAIFDAWAARKGAMGSWDEAVAAHARRDEFPASHEIVSLARIEARAALEAALSGPVAWRVHDFHVVRKPVKARGRSPELTEYLYPTDREQDARDAARTLGAECTPLYAAHKGDTNA